MIFKKFYSYNYKVIENPKGVFAKLVNPKAFSELLTVMNGTVAWDVGSNRDEYNCIDMDPCKIFAAPVVKALLER